jgi:hypothetical protein
MAYKVNDTTVIDDTGNIQSVAGLTLNNDSGVISVQSTSPMVGTVAGYTSGGNLPPSTNVVEKFPFATDTNSTDHSDLTQARHNPAGHSSEINGYVSGGTPGVNTIDKFSFAVNTNATDVGNLTFGKYAMSGTSSPTHGYTSSGFPASSNTIQKFPFSADSNATDVGDLTQGRAFAGSVGQSSTTFGYHAGGYSGPPRVTLNTIDKFPFSADSNATDVGDLSEGKESASGQSSSTHGYSSGGFSGSSPPYTFSSVIDKFPFASDTNATNIATLTVGRLGSAGQSSINSGYSSGGSGLPSPPATIFNTIDKFPFATDTNATDVGDLTAQKTNAAGQQD